jgi:FtsP/CotA-like multicopper oxidase with cupredoxin domain
MSRHQPLSRRELLARSGAVVGGAVLLGSGLGLSARPAWADVVAGDYAEPEVRKSVNGRLTTQLRVAQAEVPIAGQSAQALVYEGTYPGPTLDINAGDELRVQLINRADQQTNLHTHGLHVSPNKPSDDVLIYIDPQHSFHYRYEVPKDHPGGTLWYHAHRHMLTDDQVFGGLFGSLIVRGDVDALPGIAGLQERNLIMSQMEIKDGKVVAASSSSLSDQATLVNARYQPTLTMETGQTQRWRLTNTSSVFLRLQLDGHPLNVIAWDGNTLPAPQPQSIVELAPGARADVLVRAPESGTFSLRSLSWASLGVFYTSMVPNPQVLATLTVTGPAQVTPDPLPATLLPFHDLADAKIDRRREFRLEEREPRGVGPLDAYDYFINGRLFEADRVNVQVALNATEEWTFRNLTYEPHPLHIHVNPFQVVARNGKRHVEPHYRDSVLVPPFGSLTIRHRFLDFTGMFVMHCHILFHEDHGMMELIEVYGKDGPGPKKLPGNPMGMSDMPMS